MERILLKDLGKPNNYFKIPIELKALPIDNTESADFDFVEEQSLLAINTVDDYEKVRFAPFNNIKKIQFRLKDKLGNPLTYSYFGYTNDDLRFRKNRFKNSFLRMNFFDSPNPSNQRLAFQIQLFNQINSFNRDINGNLLDVTISPVIYEIIDPITIRNGISEGFYLYWLKYPKIDEYPLNFYMYPSFANAVDGNNTNFVSYSSAVSINQYNSINFIKYILTLGTGTNIYRTDVTDRQINQSGDTLIIDLYLINIV